MNCKTRKTSCFGVSGILVGNKKKQMQKVKFHLRPGNPDLDWMCHAEMQQVPREGESVFVRAAWWTVKSVFWVMEETSRTNNYHTIMVEVVLVPFGNSRQAD